MKSLHIGLICLALVVSVGSVVGVLLYSRNKKSDFTSYDLDVSILNNSSATKVWTFWTGDHSPTVSLCLNSIQRACDESKAAFQHIHLDLAKAKQLLPGVADHPCFCETSNAAALTSDIIRFHLLERYGGVWVDASILFLVPLDQVFDMTQSHVFQAFQNPDNCPENTSDRFPVIETSIMYSPRHHPIMRAWLSKLNLRGCCDPMVRDKHSMSLPFSSSLTSLSPSYHLVYFALYDYIRSVGGIQNIPNVKLHCTKKWRYFAYKTIHLPDLLTLSKAEFETKYNTREQKLIKLVSRNYKLLDTKMKEAKNDCILRTPLETPHRHKVSSSL